MCIQYTSIILQLKRKAGADWQLYYCSLTTEAEFYDVIGSKVLRVLV
jgi:hypothetical protein